MSENNSTPGVLIEEIWYIISYLLCNRNYTAAHNYCPPSGVTEKIRIHIWSSAE